MGSGSGGAGSGAHSFLLLINETAIHSESRLSPMVIGESLGGQSDIRQRETTVRVSP